MASSPLPSPPEEERESRRYSGSSVQSANVFGEFSLPSRPSVFTKGSTDKKEERESTWAHYCKGANVTPHWCYTAQVPLGFRPTASVEHQADRKTNQFLE
jgi:hypothetical protein